MELREPLSQKPGKPQRFVERNLQNLNEIKKTRDSKRRGHDRKKGTPEKKSGSAEKDLGKIEKEIQGKKSGYKQAGIPKQAEGGRKDQRKAIVKRFQTKIN